MTEKILVTGGLGFLGSHLVDELLKRPCEITIVDNMSSNVVASSRYEQRCRIVPVDITDYEPEGEVFHQIYHLADVAGPARILSYAGDIGRKSILGLINVLKAATPDYTRVLVVSSSEVYGRPGQFSEEADKIVYSPYTVRLEYAVAKTLCEVAALNFSKVSGVAVNIVRPFNIAGPRQSPVGGFVLPRFFEAALSNRPITVFGDGQQVRCFTHVKDTADSLITVMDSSTTGTIWNSGNPHNKISISELAFKVKDLCGSKSEVIYVDPRDIYGPLYAEAFDKVPNITKIQETLNWIPKKSLSDVLNDVLSFYKGSEIFWESNRQDGESIDRMAPAAATAGKIGG